MRDHLRGRRHCTVRGPSLYRSGVEALHGIAGLFKDQGLELGHLGLGFAIPIGAPKIFSMLGNYNPNAHHVFHFLVGF